MLQLLRFLIFGKRCNHDWVLDHEMKPFSNAHKYIYICKKCGKIKKVRLNISSYE